MKVELTDVTCVVVNESFVRVEFTVSLFFSEGGFFSCFFHKGPNVSEHLQLACLS